MSFRNKTAEKAAKGVFSKSIPADIRKRVKMRLDRVNAAVALDDLRVPASHTLEALKGDHRKRPTQH